MLDLFALKEIMHSIHLNHPLCVTHTSPLQQGSSGMNLFRTEIRGEVG